MILIPNFKKHFWHRTQSMHLTERKFGNFTSEKDGWPCWKASVFFCRQKY